jgi:hypothetical protein
MGYIRQLGQCRTVRGYEDGAGQYGLCKTVQDRGLWQTVPESVGYVRQCSTVQGAAWLYAGHWRTV